MINKFIFEGKIIKTSVMNYFIPLLYLYNIENQHKNMSS